MEIGYFTMPSHPPECGLKEGHDWDLQVLRWLDELGYQRGLDRRAPHRALGAASGAGSAAGAGVAADQEHPLGPGGFLLPYHHPAELANRVAMLDHLSGGRLNFGVAASGLPSDWAMFNVDGMSGQNRDMTREALEIILKMWTEDAPWTYNGKFWTVTKPDTMFDFLKPHLKPKQAPHPPIGVAGLSKGSRHAEARRRARLHPDEPQPQPGLCRQPLGIGRDRRRQNRPQAEPAGLAAGARGVRRRYRRGGDGSCRPAT